MKTEIPARLLKSLRRLNAAQCRAVVDGLVAWLEARIVELETPPRPPQHSRRNPVRRVEAGAVSYQLEYVRCGKPCVCMTSAGHGPYWYSYQRRGSRVVSKYLGREIPDEVARRELEQMDAADANDPLAPDAVAAALLEMDAADARA